MTGPDIALLAFCIAAETARELCFKRAVDNDEKSAKDIGLIRMVLTTPLLWMGIGVWVAEMTGWVLLLEDVPLSIAFPIMSLVYVTVPFCSSVLLKESINPKQWLAAGVITIGVALVGASGV